MTGTVYFDPAVGGDGSTVTDDSNATTGLGNSGARTRLVPMFQQAVVVAGTCVTKAQQASASAVTAAVAATGGAYSIAYTFSTTTTDSDPGNGTVRLDNATQNAATTIRTDLLDATSNTVTAILDTFVGSTSIIKGQIRMSKLGDNTKWLTFNLTAEATPSGYRNFTIANTGSSATSPFANGDMIVLQFTRTGDMGMTGGAVTVPYTFSSTTTDADPGNGVLRLSNATQNAATTIRTDLLASDGTDWTAVLDTLDASSSTVKGTLRLSKVGDQTKWLLFNVTARATPSGYRNFTVTNTGSSAASPFVDADAILLTFTRTGDIGLTGSSFNTVGAGGTVDAITATFSPAITLSDLQLCAFVSTGTNTLTNPTFAPNGLTAHTITTRGGGALIAGDIGPAGYVGILEYNLANTRWELLNPVGGTAASKNTGTSGATVPLLNGNNTFSGTTAFTGTATLTAVALNEATTVTVGSATTTNIGAAASNNVDISGTTTITGFDNVAAGINRKGRFTGILTLTYNATSLILPGAANITTAANDTYEALSLGSGNWIVTKYQKASGVAVVVSAASLPHLWGDGSDGNVTVSGAVSLTKDMYYNNLTLSAGAALNTAGYRIFVAGTLDMTAAPAGAVFRKGATGAAGNSSGSGGAGNSGLAAANLGGSPTAGSGGADAGGPGVGGNGNVSVGPGNCNGGGTPAAGGAGGNSVGNAGGSGATTATATFVGQQIPFVPSGLSITGTTLAIISGGASGSGGGAGGCVTTHGGGGGGGGQGAGVIVIFANIIARGSNATASIINATGGTGGAGGNGSSTNDSGGGGGTGGGGGFVMIGFGTRTGSAITNAIDIGGGTGGVGGTGNGTGKGGQGGGAGDSGTLYLYDMTAGTLTATNTIAGTTGSTTANTTGGAGATNAKKVNL